MAIADISSRRRGEKIPPIESGTLLELFVLHYRVFTPRIRNALAAGDLNTAFLFSHILKSASGAIRAIRPSHRAAKLEARVRLGAAPEEIEAQVSGIGEEIGRLMARVDRMLAETDQQPH